MHRAGGIHRHRSDRLHRWVWYVLWGMICVTKSMSCEVWSVLPRVCSVRCDLWYQEYVLWGVICGTKSMSCEVWSVVPRVCPVRCDLWYQEYVLWGVICGTKSMSCEVWSVQRNLWYVMWADNKCGKVVGMVKMKQWWWWERPTIVKHSKPLY